MALSKSPKTLALEFASVLYFPILLLFVTGEVFPFSLRPRTDQVPFSFFSALFFWYLAMNSSTRSLASESLYCLGGDFLK